MEAGFLFIMLRNVFTTGFCFSSHWFLQVLFMEALVEKPGGVKTAMLGSDFSENIASCLLN